MKKNHLWIGIGMILAVAVGFAVIGLYALAGGKSMNYRLKNRGDLGPLTKDDIVYRTVEAPAATSKDGTINAKDWSSVYPEIALTMGNNSKNSYVVSYLEQDPYLVNIYEGYGFAKDYGSARGHEYTLEDVAATERPHPMANCLTCKTPNFAKLVNDLGVSVYTMDFNEVMAKMEENISCYTCHGNEAGNAGQLVVTHSYVNKALGDAVSTINPATLSCGQCHIEYYFTPSDKETMMPYHDVASMTPEAILAYYDEMDFADWTQESTGTKLLKAQHPEMETFLQGKHAGFLSCADCHMPIETTKNGEAYHSHELVSPLENEALLASCATCHGDTDMVKLVKGIQSRITARETEVGNKLSEFKDALAAAVSEGKMSEDELNAVRKLHREAQWFFDYCYVENSEGAHNSELANRCLDTSEAKISEGMALLGLEVKDAGKESGSNASMENASGSYKPGTYSAEAVGFGGPVKVELTVGEGGGVTNVTVTGDSETPDVGGKAIPQLADQILKAQSAEVDGVSGASVTSGAVKEAAGKAFAQASGQETADVPKPEGDNLFVPGTYTGTAKGFGGDINVTVTLSENKIEDIKIEGDHETENIGSFAVSMLGDKILEAQSPEVDALSGATVSSNGIIRALNSALTMAGADLSRFAGEAAEGGDKIMSYEDLDCDIVIVGAGGAGMTAAITATQAGKKVILLEKMPYVGGNTTKATGGMNAAETHYQKEQGIEDTVEQFVEDTMKGGHDINNRDLVTIMAKNSSSAIDWLDSIGAPLPKVSFSGGATNKRIHAPEDGSGVGAFLVTRFLNKVEELGIQVMYNTTATNLITEEGKVTGVMAEGPDAYYTIHAKATILATGGFGNNQSMIVKYRKDLQGTVTTSAPGITGDGIRMAEAVGADLVDIDQIQLHPTVEQATSMLITESVRGDGAILVNQEGKRFINELLTRDVVSAGELQQTGSYAYIIFDQRLRDGLKAIEKYVSTGITVQADTIEDLAKQLDIDPATLAETLKNWNQYVADKKDPEFGRDTGMDADLSVAPYYAIKIAPGIHHTMGGVKINTEAQVIDTAGKPIPGLFAAGEVCGGVHGGNRIGGNAVADIVVFGRVASDSAVKYCDEQ